MRNRKGMLAAGCALALLLTPVTAYGDTAAHTSPRLEIPVVGSNGEAYANVAISRVSNYVNVRTEPATAGGIVGKIYNNCAATILNTVDGEGGTWYEIQSGSVKGYIKAEYFLTGAEAEKVAKEVGTVCVTVNTDTLRLREKPDTASATLTLLSRDAEYIAVKEEGDFIQIQVDADLSGYVHKDYVNQRVEFDQAVSLEEERQMKEEAEQRKKEAQAAIDAMEQMKEESRQAAVQPEISQAEIGFIQANPTEEPVSGNNGKAGENGTGNTSESGSSKEGSTSGPGGGSNGEGNTSGPGGGSPETGGAGGNGNNSGTGAGNTAGPGASQGENSQNGASQAGPGSEELVSATRNAIVAYAKQFLGNPYVYGGTSLTEGADCSGFTMKIFEHFGIDTGRSSRDQAAKGKEIPIDSIRPGDLLFYASGDTINHVALYIGGGQIIHASTPKNGIMITTAYYRTPCKAVTFLD